MVVTPDEVWADPARARPEPEPGAEPARHSFMGPIVLVTVLSSVLLGLFLAAVGLWLWLKR